MMAIASREVLMAADFEVRGAVCEALALGRELVAGAVLLDVLLVVVSKLLLAVGAFAVGLLDDAVLLETELPNEVLDDVLLVETSVEDLRRLLTWVGDVPSAPRRLSMKTPDDEGEAPPVDVRDLRVVRGELRGLEAFWVFTALVAWRARCSSSCR